MLGSREGSMGSKGKMRVREMTTDEEIIKEEKWNLKYADGSSATNFFEHNESLDRIKKAIAMSREQRTDEILKMIQSSKIILEDKKWTWDGTREICFVRYLLDREELLREITALSEEKK